MGTLYTKIAISVILPVYNVEKYIGECLESILHQTLNEIEIICVDDGSTDASQEIIKRYMQKYDNISLYVQENQGPGPARNKGLSYANGEYVAFFDPDDIYTSDNVLKKLYAFAKKYNANICGGNMVKFIDGESGFKVYHSKYYIETDGFKTVKEYQCLYSHQRYIFKRLFLEQHCLRYPNYVRGEDPIFMAKALVYAGKIYFCSDIIFYYRTYRNRYFSSYMLIDRLKSCKETLKIAADNSFKEMYLSEINCIKNVVELCRADSFYCEDFWDTIRELNDIINSSNKVFSFSGNKFYIVTKNEWIEYINEFINTFIRIKNNKIVIYGAGKMGHWLLSILNLLKCNVISFCVTNKSKDGNIVYEVPVLCIDDIKYDNNVYFIIAIRDKEARMDVIGKLRQKEYNNIIEWDYGTYEIRDFYRLVKYNL